MSTLSYKHFRVYHGGMKRYLSVTEVAERTGLALNTVKSYSQDTPRRMPNPDVLVGRVKGWTEKTIDEWQGSKQ